MKVLYTSPVFKNVDGSGRQFKIPLAALSTYQKRDAALRSLIDLGGITAVMTAEVVGLRKKMLSAKRKIEREGWFCEAVA